MTKVHQHVVSMIYQHRRLAMAAMLAAAVLGVSASARAGSVYTLTDLGTLGGSYSQANAINNAGQVVGFSSTGAGGPDHAFLYNQSGIHDLGTLGVGGPDSYALGINNSGQIVGASGALAFVYDGTGMHNIGDGQANAINNAGQIVGTSGSGAFLYDNTGLRALGDLGGGWGGAKAINDAGQIVGFSNTADGATHAVAYDGASPRDLGDFGGSYSQANGINNAGQIVGVSSTADGEPRAFLYDGTGLHDLGEGQSNGINNAGQIVGSSDASGAFLYSNGVMVNLNTLIDPSLGWYLDSATAINDHGQIVGFGHDAANDQHAFLLSLSPQAVPEPSSLALAAIGCMTVAGYAARKRAARAG